MAKVKYVYRDAFLVGVFICLPATLLGLIASSGSIDIIATLLFFIWLWTFLKVKFTDPGTVPLNDEWMFNPCIEKIYERDKNGYLRYCDDNNCFIPDRSHKDAKTKKIILKMDHYCPWIGQIIGNNNYRFFHQLLFYSSLSSIYLIYLFSSYIKIKYKDNTVPWGYLYFLFLGLILSIITSLCSLGLYLLHSHLIITNITMIEWLKNKNELNWSTGSWLGNIKQVYQTDRILTCLLPIGPPAHDGLYFISGLQKSKSSVSELDRFS